MSEPRTIPSHHVRNLATLLHHDRIRSHDFAVSTLYYLAMWAEGKVDSSPNGPVWHDQEAEATWRQFGGGKDDAIEGEIVPPPALPARIITDDDCDACNGTTTGQFCRAHDWHNQ